MMLNQVNAKSSLFKSGGSAAADMTDYARSNNIRVSSLL